jgi:O-antigen ligase
MFVSGRRIVYRHLIGMLIVALLLFLASEYTFDIYSRALDLLGRDATLTDRTRLWADVIELQDSPILGKGFESFWLGERAVIMAEEWWWHPNQAHNGYLETYLNLGFVGLFLLLAVIVSTFRNIKQQLPVDLGVARLRLAYLLAILAFNYTEAAFKGVHVVLTIFFIIAIRYDRARAMAGRETRAPTVSKRASDVPTHAVRNRGAL